MTQQTQNKQLPKGWKGEQFTEVVEILDSKRKPINSTERQKRIGDIPYYGATGQVGWIDNFLFDEELILLGEDAAPFLEPYKDKAYLIKGKSWVNNHAHVLRTKGGLINKFLLYFLNNFDYHEYVTGTTRLKLNQSRMKEIKILLPPPPLQSLIVSAIETQFTRLDVAVKNLKAVKQKLGIYRKAVLKEAFQGKLAGRIQFNKEELIKEINEYNKKKEGQNKTRRLPEIDYNSLNFIPNEWFFMGAHKICSSVRDGTHDSPKYVSIGYPLITSKNLKEGELDLSKINYISKEDYFEVNKRSKVDQGDLLFAMIGTIGNPVVIKEEPNFAIKNVGLFKNKEEKFILTNYLKYWLDSPIYLKILEQKKLIKGTTQRFIDLGSLRISPIPICSISEQSSIVSSIESKFSVIDKVEETVNNALVKAERLRKSILKSAFEGKLVKEE